MTVPADSRRREYIGNGVTTVFNGPMAFQSSHVQVFRVSGGALGPEEHLIPSGQYSIDSLGRVTGTRVVFSSPVPDGQKIVMLRTMPYTQEVSIENQGAFHARTVEDGYDALGMQIQQLADGVDRSLRIPDSWPPGVDTRFPFPEASRLIGWNADGSALRNTDPSGPGDLSLRSDLADPTGGGSLVAFRADAPTAGNRSLLSKARDFVSVKDFGAVGDGVANDTAAIQAAVDSEWPIRFPPGTYRITSTINLNKHKIIKFEGALMEPHDSSPGNEFAPGRSHARIVSNQNIHFFEITHHGVFISGGTFDAREIASHTQAIFHYNMARPSASSVIWGGEIIGFNILGNRAMRGVDGAGTDGIRVTFSGAQVNGSYITHCKWQGRCESVRRGFYSTPLEEGRGQFANACEIDLEADGVKQAIVLHSINESKVRVRTQSRHVLHENEKDLAQVVIYPHRVYLEILGWDFDGTLNAGLGAWKGMYLVENHSATTRLLNFDNRESRESSPKSTAGFYNPHVIEGARGILPRGSGRYGVSGWGTFDQRAVVLSDLHNSLLGLHKKSVSFTVAAHSGAGVDFAALETSSEDASIPVSSNITLNYPDNLFADQIANEIPSFSWNSAAISAGDFVEIHAKGFPATRVDMFWIALGTASRRFQAIQLIGKSAGVVTFNDIITEIPITSTNDPLLTLKHRITPVRRNMNELIIRFIGCTSTGAIQIHDIGSNEASPRSDEGSFMRRYAPDSRWGELRQREGDLYLQSGAWNGGTLLRMGNHRLWVDASGKLRIKSGVPTSDTDGDVVGTQA